MKVLDNEHILWLYERTSEYPNISLSLDYSDVVTYEICRKADIIVSVQSSLVDECIAYGKKVILIDDLFTVNNLCSGIYPPEFDFMIIRSLPEFVDRIQRMLTDERFLEDEYKELRNKISGNYPLESRDSVPEILEQFFSDESRVVSF
jgi:hypothetical protein